MPKDHQTLLSYQGKEIADGLIKSAAERNPDEFDMYVDNDLVDTILSTAHAKIAEKAYQEAYYLLEGLTLFNDLDQAWPVCDDVERVKITDKAYGTLIVTLLRGFEAEGILNATHLPALESFLKLTSGWADQQKRLKCTAAYGPYCKSLGEKLFTGLKTSEETTREKKRLKEWIETLEPERQQWVKQQMEEDHEVGGAQNAWYKEAGDIDEASLVLEKVWKEYKDYLSGVLNKPSKGPGTWEISKWTAGEREPFLFKHDPTGASNEASDIY
ncbi:hypothetical protein DXG03_000207 [Asterophora parasitica]|uniref:Uncharacterized protein n=1 Tax=Asterophora parasitica TaxID=117018 RepID=A0A9P7GHV1_9AGAR|nr:hypothetical protein DXG03_000207 [Asterophora parasitica]